MESASVALRLIWMVVAPAAFAMSVSEAAGWTSDDVPQTIKTWDSAAALRAVRQARVGSASPNQTTPGRIQPPQFLQPGGSSRAP